MLLTKQIEEVLSNEGLDRCERNGCSLNYLVSVQSFREQLCVTARMWVLHF